MVRKRQLEPTRSSGSQEQKMFGKHFLPRAIAAVRRRLAGRQQSRRYRWLARSGVVERLDKREIYGARRVHLGPP